MKSPRALRALLVFALFTVTVSAPAAPANAATVEQWRNDIEILRTEIARLHPDPFQFRPRSQFDADLDALSANVPLLSDGEIIIGMQKAVAALQDGHTEVDMRGVIGSSYFPIRLEWMSDGLWVTKTTVDLVAICGARLVSINDVPVETLHATVSSVVSSDNDGWSRVRTARYIPDAKLLALLGVIPAVGPVRFVFETQHGLLLELDLSPKPVHLLRNSLFAPDPETDDTPLYRRDPTAFYWFEHLEDEHVLYLKYNLCVQGPEPFSTFAKRIFDIADANPVDRFVVDMRNNVGGSDAVLRPLIDGLVARPALNRHDRLFVVIGPQTFSSAVINAVQFLQMTAATLVGEPTGGNANHHGQVSSFLLPGSGVTVYHSTKTFELLPGVQGGVPPHIPITTSSRDYFTNTDPILEAIITLESPSGTPKEGRRRSIRRTTPRNCPF